MTDYANREKAREIALWFRGHVDDHMTVECSSGNRPTDCLSDRIAAALSEKDALIAAVRKSEFEAGRREGMEAKGIIRTLEEQQTDVNNAYAEGIREGREKGLEEAAKLAAECLDVGKSCKHVTATFIEEHKAYDFGWCMAAENIEREIRALKEPKP